MGDEDPKPPPPAQLSLSWSLKRWGSLPESGGYLEQDYKLMRTMETLDNVYSAITAFQRAGQTKNGIHNLPDSVRRIIGSLKKQGYI